MSWKRVDLLDLVIPISTSPSNSIDLRAMLLRGLTLLAPAALTGTITVQVSKDDSTWYDLHGTTGAAITIGIDTAVTVDPLVGLYVRINSSGTEAAERTFEVVGHEELL